MMTRSPFQEALKLPLFVPVLRDRLLCHPHSIVPDKRFQNRWSIHANQEQNDLFSLFSRQKTMFFRSQDDWLSKRSRGSDLKTPENDSESPSLSDHRFSHSPSMAYPLAGCFVSANLLKLRHLCRFSVSSNPTA